jgi:hypothetical protein
MPTPSPTTAEAWLVEVLDSHEVAAMAAVGEGLDAEADRERWIAFMQRQAVELGRGAREIAAAAGDPERQLDDLDEVDDLAHGLRDALPGEVREVVSEAQLFLLFYLAAHLHARLIDRTAAAEVVRACWQACGDDDADEPWEIGVPSPGSARAWSDEIIAAYARSAAPAPLPLCEDGPYLARPGSLLEAAAVVALANRGALPRAAAVAELIDTIKAMEADVSGMGPEWQEMQRIPALAFAMYYVWVHLAMGIAHEDQAMEVMRECTARLADFADLDAPPRPSTRGTDRQRRR